MKMKPSPQSRIGKFLLCLIFLSFSFCLLISLSACAKKSQVEQAQGYIQQSQVYYQKAIRLYKELIAKGKDLDRLHFELGYLYYNHGEFAGAIEEFKNTNDSRANKFLAVSYYRLGNFTDALEVFGKIDHPDDECLYYYGLTAEKLNLFERALELYKKTRELAPLALERINAIEKQVSAVHIKDIDPQVNNILASAPSQDEYPQAGALILFCDEKIEITPQNTQVSTFHYIVKILNERGKESFAETHIDYDSTYEKVELEYARIIKPDGGVVEVGSRHIRDVSKYLNFPLYSNVRVYIISFPEITEGASIEYKVKIHCNQLINKKDFVINYPLQASEPILEANFTIDLPPDRTLYIKTLNEKYNDFGATLTPQIQKKDDRLIYSWQFKDIPQIIPEPGMAPEVEINSTMLISTFDDWQDIYNWWWLLSKDKIKADLAIKDKVGQLTQGLVLPEAKIRAIYNFCARQIRYVAVEYGQAGYEPHLAADIFKNKYGDCKDQAVLLVTMLKEAGFSAWLVLIPTKGYYNLNPDFPAVLFNHCIAAVSIDGRVTFIDPTAETCSFGDLPGDDQGRGVIVFKEDGYQIQSTPLYPAEHNLMKQSLNIKVKPDETITAEKSIFTFGRYDQAQRAWLLYTPPELIEQALKEKIQEVSIGAKLDEYNIKNLEDLSLPLVLSYAFRGPEYFTVAGSFRIMPQLAGVDTSLVAKDKRRYPIDFGILDTREAMFEIELPSNFAIKYMPQDVNEDSPWLKFNIEYEHKDNRVIIIQKTELKKTMVLESEYSDFKDFFEGLAKQVKQRIVIERLR